MSIVTELLLICDGGSAGLARPEDSSFNIDGAKDAIVINHAQLRAGAGREGWIGHKDFCASCASQMKSK